MTSHTNPQTSALQGVLDFHRQTKHHFHRSARSLGYLDWANQPNPFRRYDGARRIPLPFMEDDRTPPYNDLYNRRKSDPAEVAKWSIAQLFELSLAISAWKEYQGSRWALRVNPSSGNLHPTEGYAILGPCSGLSSKGIVCHYSPLDHSLEVRTEFPEEVWRGLMTGFPPGSFLTGLTSIHWREAWKYGERAYRYCQHDVGHALACLSISAAALGWRLVHLEELADDEVSALLGLDREGECNPIEREHPDLLAIICPQLVQDPAVTSLFQDGIARIAGGDWQGVPNLLSQDHQEWKIIEQVSAAAAKPHSPRLDWNRPASREEHPLSLGGMAETLLRGSESARKLILERRSAVAYDGKTSIPAGIFFHILAQTLPLRPESGVPLCPWDSIRWGGPIHLCLFVHRVDGLPPGLYVLVRDPGKTGLLKSSMRKDFLWEKPQGCPTWLPLFFLLAGDARSLAAQVSCGQDIAGDGVFSLGMVAEFQPSLERYGPWFYRYLFWETGMIGQVLYLEAEAAGIRATGIGCYFDDPVHEVFGFEGTACQSLYHFTMGGPLEDTRLTTLPPYSP